MRGSLAVVFFHLTENDHKLSIETEPTHPPRKTMLGIIFDRGSTGGIIHLSGTEGTLPMRHVLFLTAWESEAFIDEVKTRQRHAKDE